MKNNPQVCHAIFYGIQVSGTQVIRQTWWLLFIELKLHNKLEFHKLKFQKNDKSLIISQTVVDY